MAADNPFSNDNPFATSSVSRRASILRHPPHAPACLRPKSCFKRVTASCMHMLRLPHPPPPACRPAHQQPASPLRRRCVPPVATAVLPSLHNHRFLLQVNGTVPAAGAWSSGGAWGSGGDSYAAPVAADMGGTSSNGVGGSSKGQGKKEADLNKREAELNKREAELRRLELEIRQNPGAKNTKNWPKFCPVLHHDIAGEIPAQSQVPVRRAYWAYLVSPGGAAGGQAAGGMPGPTVTFRVLHETWQADCGWWTGCLCTRRASPHAEPRHAPIDHAAASPRRASSGACSGTSLAAPRC